MQALTTIDNKSIRKVTLLFLLKNIQEVQQKITRQTLYVK